MKGEKSRQNAIDNVIDKEAFPLACLAGMAGLPRILAKLLKEGADATWRNQISWTLLHACAYGGSIEALRTCLELDVFIDVNIVDCHRHAPLHYAALAGQEAAAELLLERRADARAMDRDNITPLHVACGMGWWSLVGKLLDAGADVNSVDVCGNTPMSLAVSNPEKDLIDVVLFRMFTLRKAGAKVSESAMNVAARRLSENPECKHCIGVIAALHAMRVSDEEEDTAAQALLEEQPCIGDSPAECATKRNQKPRARGAQSRIGIKNPSP